MTDIDAATAAALVTFSGIAAAWIPHLGRRDYRYRFGFASNLLMTVMAILFGLATVLSLLFLLGHGGRDLLCASGWLAFVAMASLVIFLLTAFVRDLYRGITMFRFGSPGELDIEKTAEREARS